MAIETIKSFNKYRYVPKNLVLSLDREYQFQDNTVTYLNLIMNYTENRLPVIQMGIECDNYTIAEIYKHKDIAKFTMEVVEECYDSNDALLSTTSFIKESLTLVPALERSAYITDTDLEVDARTDHAKQLQHFEFYLVDLDKVKWFDQECNFSAKNTTFPAMLQSIFMARRIPGKVIIASPPLIPDAELSKVVLPIGSLINNIKTLNTKYGLYDCNPIIFWDMKYMYCLNKRIPNTQMEDTTTDFGNITFTLYDPDDQHHFVHGSYDDADTSTHFINVENQPKLRDISYQDRFVKTTEIITVDKNGEITRSSVDKDTSGEGLTEEQTATKMTYVYKENALSHAQVMNELITGPILDLSVKEISVKFLRPYKDYRFDLIGQTYNNLGIGGKLFRLLQWTLAIRRDGSSSYLHDVSMSLYCPFRDGWEYEFDPKADDEIDEETAT